MSVTFPVPRQSRKTEAVASAGQTVFPLSFGVIEAADVVVQVKPVGAVAWTTLDVSAFSVGSVHPASPASVTLVSGLALGTAFRAVSRRVASRTTNIVRDGAVKGAVLEKEIDSLVVAASDVRRDMDDASGAFDEAAQAAATAVAASGTAVAAAGTATSASATAVAAAASVTAVGSPGAGNVGKIWGAISSTVAGWVQALPDIIQNTVRIAPSANGVILELRKNASGQINRIQGMLNSLITWDLVLGNATARSGSNAGDAFELNRYDDAGAYLGVGLTIGRATGNIGTANGAIPTASYADASVTAVKVAAEARRKLGGAKNYFVNAAFSLNQRYPSGLVITAGNTSYTADRWRVATGGSQVTFGLSAASAPGIFETVTNAYHAYMQLTTLVGNTQLELKQRIPAADVRRGLHGTIMVSAWVYQSSGGSKNFVFAGRCPTATDNWASDNQRGASGNLAVPDVTWTRITWTTSTAAWTDIEKGLEIVIQGANLGACITLITCPQIETGDVATGFSCDADQINLMLCKRFYRKSFPLTTAPVQNGGAVGAESARQNANASTAHVAAWDIAFDPPMQKAPTVTLYNPYAANAQIRNTTTSADWTLTAAADLDATGFTITGTTPAGSVNTDKQQVHWSADAEL